jgi:hypothetical protein
MNCDSCFASTTGKHRAMHPLSVHTLPAEGRQQRRVRIHDVPAIRRHHSRRYQLEKAGKDQKIDSLLIQ